MSTPKRIAAEVLESESKRSKTVTSPMSTESEELVPFIKLCLAKTLMYDCNKIENKYHSNEWSPIEEHMEALQGKCAVNTLILMDIEDTFSSKEIDQLYDLRKLWKNQTLEIYPIPPLDDPDEQTCARFLASVSSLLDKEFVYQCRELIITGLGLNFAEKAKFFTPKIIQINKGPGPFNITAQQLSGILRRLEGMGRPQDSPILSVQISTNFKKFLEQIREDFRSGSSGGMYNYNVILQDGKFGATFTFDVTRENSNSDRLQLKSDVNADILAIFGDAAPKSLGYPVYLLKRTLSQ